MTEPAPHRIGCPSPLAFHLASAAAAYQQAMLAAPRAADPLFPWHPLMVERPDRAPDPLSTAAEAGKRLSAMLRGIELWQCHPYRRKVTDPKTVWQNGSSCLLDYGTAPEARDPAGIPVLLVPSLINRAYILDLGSECSLARYLAAQGLRPFLLDWGTPGPAEHEFTLDTYALRRLLPAAMQVTTLTGRAPALLGYCMGGTLAAGLAAQWPGSFPALATIGAPWDFSQGTGIAAELRNACRGLGADRIDAALDQLGQAFGFAPVELFQSLFAMLNPVQAARKFRNFGGLDMASNDAAHFVAIEDWLADGVTMAVPAARNLLVDWQLRNVTATGDWTYLGSKVHLSSVEIPSLIGCGLRDSIAPPALAEPLAAQIPGAQLLSPDLGHVGMVVGSGAKTGLWEPLSAFLMAQGAR